MQLTVRYAVKKMVRCIVGVVEQGVESTLVAPKDTTYMKPMEQSWEQELNVAAKELEKKQKKELARLKKENLTQYAIKGSEHEWGKALETGNKGILSVKSGEKRLGELADVEVEEPETQKKKKKRKSLTG